MNQNVNKLIAGIMAGVMMLGAVAGFSSLKPDVVRAEEAKTNRKVITVSGEAKVRVEPDIAYITVGVRTEGKTAEAAQTENAKKMSAVVDSLKKLGLDSKDLRTSNYSVHPIYDYNYVTMKEKVQEVQKTERVLKGYEANNNLDVTIRDLTKVGAIIDISVKNGSNMTDSIRFSISDQSAAYNKALAGAMKNAQSKATSLAEVVGITLSKPSRISEQSYGGGIAERYSNYTNSKMAMDTAEASTTVESGELIISANVSVEYEY